MAATRNKEQPAHDIKTQFSQLIDQFAAVTNNQEAPKPRRTVIVMYPPDISIEQWAALTGLTLGTARGMHANGLLPTFKRGRRVFVDLEKMRAENEAR